MNARRDAFEAEAFAYRRARSVGDTAAAWRHLERAHIVGQPLLGLHIRSHVLMLGYAVAERDLPESAGQLLRLALAPIGNLTGRLPLGNTGRSDVSAFVPMAVPADLRALDATDRAA
jgi:hypothetical protein